MTHLYSNFGYNFNLVEMKVGQIRIIPQVMLLNFLKLVEKNLFQLVIVVYRVRKSFLQILNLTIQS